MPLLVSPGIGVDEARVSYTLASDHLPVVAELTLPGPEVGIGRARTGDERGSGIAAP